MKKKKQYPSVLKSTTIRIKKTTKKRLKRIKKKITNFDCSDNELIMVLIENWETRENK